MFAVAPLVSSTRLTLVNCTVIGGLHSGWNVAVSVRLKFASPLFLEPGENRTLRL